MPYVKFLEEFSLYKKFKMKFPSELDKIPKPAINLFCEKCGKNQTFTMINEYYENKRFKNSPTKGEVILAEYLCAGCSIFKRHFLIKVSENLDFIKKIGQYPPWDISTDRNLSKMLHEHNDLFKKGLVCESQSYGIGAYAYYRRIVEIVIDELLDSIYELVEDENKKEYKKALDKTKKSRIAEEKIEMVKDLIPQTLRPGGANPLLFLYDILSQGIHESNEEECMEFAENVRSILVSLINQIMVTSQSSREYSDSIKKILDRKIK